MEGSLAVVNDDLEATVNAFINRAWNEGDFSAAQALFTTGFQHHDLVTQHDTDVVGYFDSIRALRRMFPNVRFEIRDSVVDGDRVASRWTVVGMHADTGRSVTVHGMSIDRLLAGRIDENWTVWVRHGLREQLRTDTPGQPT